MECTSPVRCLFAASLLLSGALVAPSRTYAAAADLILQHGHVRTQSAGQSLAEAVAIRGGTVIYVGTNAGAEALRGATTEVVDLGGKTVLPGLAGAWTVPPPPPVRRAGIHGRGGLREAATLRADRAAR